jgi:putative ABC transport system ATP-binding protein
MNPHAAVPSAHTAGVDPDADRHVLSARALVYSYGSTPALRGVSVHVDAGEVLAITGPSGSGKSTLMLCLSGVLRPDAGAVRFGDHIISNSSESERSKLRRSEFGILFQFGQLVPELTAAENVALPLLLSGVKRKPAITAATNWLDRFGVADQAASRPAEMSGGQAQRAAAARAMVTEPKVLLADEPTGALDALAGEQVMSQIVRVARESSTSVVIITHDAKIAAHGDREVAVRDGMIDTVPREEIGW